jgi:SAM-dependent methyltransferase
VSGQPAETPVAIRTGAEDSARESALRALEANPTWYHTLALPGGVLTPGMIDLRSVAAKVLPADLRGKRALDVGTFDGFWAFELERRGAEVVAIDIAAVSDAELPPNNRDRLLGEADAFEVEIGRGFRIAADLLGMRARHVVCNVLELTPEAIGGPVDVAFIGALLIHLRDPVRALERILSALVPGGQLYQLETISLGLSLLHPRRPVARMQTLQTPFNWWRPNWATLRAWLRTAGFVEIKRLGLLRPPQRPPMHDWQCAVRSRRPS